MFEQGEVFDIARNTVGVYRRIEENKAEKKKDKEDTMSCLNIF